MCGIPLLNLGVILLRCNCTHYYFFRTRFREFYRVSPDELQLSTIIGTITVSALALLFIPHWTAVLFVAPIMICLYVDLLGWIQLLGVHVNPVMYISYVMSSK